MYIFSFPILACKNAIFLNFSSNQEATLSFYKRIKKDLRRCRDPNSKLERYPDYPVMETTRKQPENYREACRGSWQRFHQAGRSIDRQTDRTRLRSVIPRYFTTYQCVKMKVMKYGNHKKHGTPLPNYRIENFEHLFADADLTVVQPGWLYGTTCLGWYFER